MERKVVRIHGMTFEEIFPPHLIAERVQSLAQEIISFHRSDPISSKDSEPIFIVVLNGATYFWVDLSRTLQDFDFNHEMDVIKITSWGYKMESSGKVVEVIKEVNADLRGRFVYIVEDIVDTGLSGTWLREKYEGQGAIGVKFITFLLKDDSLEHDFSPDFIGLRAPKRFLIGYGLDYNQTLRGLRGIYALRQVEEESW